MLLSLSLIFTYFLLVVDYYSGCQLRGTDAACFFGTFRVFGSYLLRGIRIHNKSLNLQLILCLN